MERGRSSLLKTRMMGLCFPSHISKLMFWDPCFTLAPNAGLLQKNPLLQVQNVSSPTVPPGLLTLLMERATLCTGKWPGRHTKTQNASHSASLPPEGAFPWCVCSFDPHTGVIISLSRYLAWGVCVGAVFVPVSAAEPELVPAARRLPALGCQPWLPRSRGAFPRGAGSGAAGTRPCCEGAWPGASRGFYTFLLGVPRAPLRTQRCLLPGGAATARVHSSAEH